MGTFHDDMGELHGITVVVDTKGPNVYIGRCEVYLEDRHILLNDADEHQDGDKGKSKQQYIELAAKVGTWKKHDRLMIKAEEIESVKPLHEFV